MDGNSTDPPSSYHSSHFSLTLNARSDENSRRKVQNVVTDSTADSANRFAVVLHRQSVNYFAPMQ
jgi:hypothetical protein